MNTDQLTTSPCASAESVARNPGHDLLSSRRSSGRRSSSAPNTVGLSGHRSAEDESIPPSNLPQMDEAPAPSSQLDPFPASYGQYPHIHQHQPYSQWHQQYQHQGAPSLPPNPARQPPAQPKRPAPHFHLHSFGPMRVQQHQPHHHHQYDALAQPEAPYLPWAPAVAFEPWCGYSVSQSDPEPQSDRTLYDNDGPTQSSPYCRPQQHYPPHIQVTLGRDHITRAVPQPRAATDGQEAPPEHTWVAWSENREGETGEGAKRICAVSTAQEHWKFLADFPVLALQLNESLHLSLDGVRPLFTDKRNRHGGHVAVALPVGHATQQYWNHATYAMVTGALPFQEQVTGMRAVRKADHLSIQLWITDSKAESAVRALKNYLRHRASPSAVISFCPHKCIMQTMRQRPNSTLGAARGPR